MKPPLTSREESILELVAEGLLNKTIAAKLGISRKTVEAHLQSVYRKVNCSNRTAAARWYLNHDKDYY